MRHRHLNHRRYSPAAIDSVITRGVWLDWARLRQAALADPTVLEAIATVSHACASDPYFGMRYRFWRQWAARNRVQGTPDAS